MTVRKKIFLILFFCAAVISLRISESPNIFADTISDLSDKINQRKSDIDQILKDIDNYQKQLVDIGKQKQSLKRDSDTLDLTKKSLNAQIKLTENKISETNLAISELDLNIGDKSEKISNDLDAIGKALGNLNQADSVSLVEALLGYDDMAKYWQEIDNLSTLQQSLKARIQELRNLKTDLEANKSEKEKKKEELVNLKADLSDQKKIVEQNQKEKDALLSATKNKESNYNKILNEKIALKNAFEKELSDFESQLRIAIDPSSIPKSGSGVLRYPLDKVVITQKFGVTSFALTTSAYANNFHNGVDFAASIGTPVKAALNGTVKGSGNTDTVCPGASFGRWILIEHDNGLSTLYTHLSLIKVSNGQRVGAGEIIAYSGNTGFTTGPHLHFTVYATQGVRIMTRKSQVCRGTYTMPVADPKAYLDPLLYL